MYLSHKSASEYILGLFLPFSLNMFDVITINIFYYAIFNAENLIAINMTNDSMFTQYFCLGIQWPLQ